MSSDPRPLTPDRRALYKDREDLTIHVYDRRTGDFDVIDFRLLSKSEEDLLGFMLDIADWRQDEFIPKSELQRPQTPDNHILTYTSSQLETTLSRIRCKLNKAYETEFISTIPRKGFVIQTIGEIERGATVEKKRLSEELVANLVQSRKAARIKKQEQAERLKRRSLSSSSTIQQQIQKHIEMLEIRRMALLTQVQITPPEQMQEAERERWQNEIRSIDNELKIYHRELEKRMQLEAERHADAEKIRHRLAMRRYASQQSNGERAIVSAIPESQKRHYTLDSEQDVNHLFSP